jgi:TonB-linked SusC/RagA family outer membrane protein
MKVSAASFAKKVPLDKANSNPEDVIYSLHKNIIAGIPESNPVPPVTVSGKVSDEKGKPYPGVSVKVKGTTLGAITDVDGRYSIKLPNGNETLVFSFLGTAAQEIAVNNRTQINVILKDQQSGLNEVVVIGYGTQKKSDLTGAISSVSSKDLETSTPLNATESLQGRASGVTVANTDGSPGSSSTIRIRGIGTVNNNNPIFVVDGMFTNNIDFLNPSDIANMEVLKDASSSAIYGSRGANGVILVTTKKGSSGKPIVSFNANSSLSQITNFPQTLDRDQYLNYEKTAYLNGYLASVPNADPNIDPFNTNLPFFSFLKIVKSEYDRGYNTNWSDLVFKKALVQNYDFAVRGSTPAARYALSAGYLNQQGIIDNSSFQRYNFRLNTDYNLTKSLVLGENLGVTYGKLSGFPTGGGGGAASFGPLGIALTVLKADPLSPEINPAASTSDPNYQYDKYYHSLLSNSYNPVSQVNLNNTTTGTLEATGNVYGELAALKGLKIRSSLGYDYTNSSNSTFAPKYFLAGSEQNAISKITEGRTSTMGLVWENTANYTTTIAEKHNISALAGYTNELYIGNSLTGSAQGTPNNDPSLQVIDAATSQYITSGNKTQTAQQSYFARLLYSFSDRYLLTASVRRDGSSKFGTGHQWGTFPSFSLGWRLNNEQFFKNLNLSFIDNLKIRGGWGQLGNQSTYNNNPNLSLIAPTVNNGGNITYYRYILGNNVVNGDYFASLGTPGLTWETSESTNIGLDLSLFNSAVTVSADYYVKMTKNMLLQIALPGYTGFPGSPYTNAGEVQNKGFETTIAYHGGSAGNFTYGISGNLSFFTNRVLSLGQGNTPIITTSILFPAVSKTAVGQPIGQFYGYVTQGIFQTQAEIDNYQVNGVKIQPNARPGDFKFKSDANGVIQQYYIGNPLPKFTYGFTLNSAYRGFDFVAFFQGVYGGKIFDASKYYASALTGAWQGSVSAYEAAWHGPGTSNTQPIISSASQNNNYRTSDWYIQSGSYLRLKNLQIGYSFKQDWMKNAGLSKARLWIGGSDLFTITKYKGNDPETDLQNPLLSGLDQAAYPKIKRYSLGVSATF